MARSACAARSAADEGRSHKRLLCSQQEFSNLPQLDLTDLLYTSNVKSKPWLSSVVPWPARINEEDIPIAVAESTGAVPPTDCPGRGGAAATDLRALQRRVDELPLRILLGLDEERRRGVEHEVRAAHDLVEGAVRQQVRLVQRQRPCREPNQKYTIMKILVRAVDT